jgi:hypothetical protein
MIPSLSSRSCVLDTTMRRGVGVATTGEEVAFVTIKHTDEILQKKIAAMPFVHFSERYELLPRLRKAESNVVQLEKGDGTLYTGKPSAEGLAATKLQRFVGPLVFAYDRDKFAEELALAREFVERNRALVQRTVPEPPASTAFCEDVIGPPPVGLIWFVRLL